MNNRKKKRLKAKAARRERKKAERIAKPTDAMFKEMKIPNPQPPPTPPPIETRNKLRRSRMPGTRRRHAVRIHCREVGDTPTLVFEKPKDKAKRACTIPGAESDRRGLGGFTKTGLFPMARTPRRAAVEGTPS